MSWVDDGFKSAWTPLATMLPRREPIGGGGASNLEGLVVCLAVAKDHVLSGPMEERDGSNGGGDFRIEENDGRGAACCDLIS